MDLLIVSSDEAVKDLLRASLESLAETRVDVVGDSSEALARVRGDDAFRGVFFDHDQSPESSTALMELMSKVSSSIQFFVLSKAEPPKWREITSSGEAFLLDKPFTTEFLKKSLLKAFGHQVHLTKTNPATDALVPEDLVRIKTKTVLKVESLPCDLYLKLSSGKILKIMSRGDMFTAEDHRKYHEKKIDYLFVRKADVEVFVNTYAREVKSVDDLAGYLDSPVQLMNLAEKLTDEDLRDDLISLARVMKQLESREVVDASKVIETTSTAHESMHKAMLRFGFTDEVQTAVRTCVSLAVTTLKQDPKLSELLGKLQVNPDAYISSHSTALAYLASAISTVLEWSSETTHYKLSLAGFLHDITLSNNDLAKCQTMIDVVSHGVAFGPEEIEQFQNHPIEAAEYVNEITMIPPDVGIIIQQHHEAPDGTGFPGGLKHNQISPLSSVFIIAHDLLNWINRNKENKTLQDYLILASKKFSVGHFAKILDQVASAISKGQLG